MFLVGFYVCKQPFFLNLEILFIMWLFLTQDFIVSEKTIQCFLLQNVMLSSKLISVLKLHLKEMRNQPICVWHNLLSIFDRDLDQFSTTTQFIAIYSNLI